MNPPTVNAPSSAQLSRRLPACRESAAVWQTILAALRLDTRVVGLQMMMETGAPVDRHKPTEGNKLAGARILRQFFAKHQSRLQMRIRS
ncbi:MAG: hypothetical protein U5P41_10475 [Gammaproteobacteria bacterium]|nr:hypothetical protein [Gammaproteobacteria bacterium]